MTKTPRKSALHWIKQVLASTDAGRGEFDGRAHGDEPSASTRAAEPFQGESAHQPPAEARKPQGS